MFIMVYYDPLSIINLLNKLGSSCTYYGSSLGKFSPEEH